MVNFLNEVSTLNWYLKKEFAKNGPILEILKAKGVKKYFLPKISHLINQFKLAVLFVRSQGDCLKIILTECPFPI